MDARSVKIIINIATVLLVGASGGAVGGYVLGKRQGRRQAWDVAQPEMDEMEDRLKRLYKIGEYSAPFSTLSTEFITADEIDTNEYATLQEHPPTLAELVAERKRLIDEGVDPEMLEKLQEHVASQGYVTTDTADTETLFDRFANEDAVEEETVEGLNITPNMDDPAPYVISEEEFNYDLDEQNEKIMVSYYPIDGVVADAQDRIVEDIEGSIGINNLSGFADDVTVLYVRNSRLRADFEIALEEGSYRKNVMGLDDEPVMERRGRKTKVKAPQDD